MPEQNDPETKKKKKNNLGEGAVRWYSWVDLKENCVILTSLLLIVVHMHPIFYLEMQPMLFLYAQNYIKPYIAL